MNDTAKVIKIKSSHKEKRDKHKKEEPEKEKEVEIVINDSESEDIEDIEDDDDDEDSESDNVSFSTTDILSNDPLYFVLSKILMTEDGKNIATILQEISTKLSVLCERRKSKHS
jgi:hypothetical protein